MRREAGRLLRQAVKQVRATRPGLDVGHVTAGGDVAGASDSYTVSVAGRTATDNVHQLAGIGVAPGDATISLRMDNSQDPWILGLSPHDCGDESPTVINL